MKFGTWLRNEGAGLNNPHREGMFVEAIRRPARAMNPGLHYRMTDGRGEFWLIQPKYLVPVEGHKPGDALVRVSKGGEVARVTIATAGPEWLTLVGEPGERYSAKTLLRERGWAMLVRPETYARHALAEALLGIEATTVEEYRNRAHALVMNWKGEEP